VELPADELVRRLHPALAAGNAVILKPSRSRPMTSLLMAEALRECGLPEHVYQVATGRARPPRRSSTRST
jgi:acyl-CoA reductase-like NAD-dependent aldehyde dehydrogenase